jgi:hypothetical protein
MLSYVTRQLAKAIDRLRDDLRDAIQEQANASRDATEAANKKWSEIPRVITSNIFGTTEDKEAAEAKRKETNRQQERLISSQEKLVKWTKRAFIAAAIYAGIAALQGILMYITYTNIQRQTKAAQCAANAAQKAADTSSSALKDVQRAFVFPSPFASPVYQPGTNGIIAVRMAATWKNSGATPTRNMQMHVSMEKMEAMPPNFAFPDRWNKDEPHQVTSTFLGPQSFTNSNPIEVSAALLQKVYSRDTHLYIWGWTTSGDVFADTKLHITKFCWNLVIDHLGMDKNGAITDISSEMNSCPRNNCADDECEK